MLEIHKYGWLKNVGSPCPDCVFSFSRSYRRALAKAGKSIDLLKSLDERLTIYRGTA
jgi:hypothetical protein